MHPPGQAGPDQRTMVLPLAPRAFETRDVVEDYLGHLNSSSPGVDRRIVNWGCGAGSLLRLTAMQGARVGAARDEVFIAESEMAFGLELRTRQTAPDAACSIALPLSGSMSIRLPHGVYTARAGQGLVFDPVDVEGGLIAPGTHFLEFNMPGRQLLDLGTEMHPAALSGARHFEPLMAAALAGRTQFMAVQAALALQADDAPARLLFARWTEMIALTLLCEQAARGQPLPRSNAVLPPTSPALRRALEYIRAHPQSSLLLADIASAACVSPSSLLRLFKSELGEAPGEFVRRMRLDRARAELRSGECKSVRELALRWGFQNASKFSIAYQRRFGESPSQTRSARR